MPDHRRNNLGLTTNVQHTSSPLNHSNCVKALVLYLPRCSNHDHHLLQVELVSGEVLNGHFVFDLTARLARIVEELPEVADPRLQQDELRGEPLEHHGKQAV